MNEKVKKILSKQHYALVGDNSALQICRWTKKSIRGDGVCYKEKFYGIPCHRCCQMSPTINFCQNRCLHCWRAIELTEGEKFEGKIDDPKEIIKKCIEAQRKMLSGFLGSKKINKKKFIEAQDPIQFAISLSGEPTLYPQLGELIKELKKQKKTSFLVTNGLLPEKLKELAEKKALPTQLYISLNYPDEKIFRKITNNKAKKAWKKFNKTLTLLPSLPTRKVIRMTLIKELNMDDDMIEEYAELIKKSKVDWIEVKGFVSVGYARKRLGYNRMPTFEEIEDYAKKIAKAVKYKIEDFHKFSKVVLLSKNHLANRFIC